MDSFQKRKIIEKITIQIKSKDEEERIHLQSNNRDSIKCIINDVKSVLDYTGNHIWYLVDGSIVITPRYLDPLPNEILALIIYHLCDMQNNDRERITKDLYECTLVNKQFYRKINSLLWHSPFISNARTLHQFLTCLANTNLEQTMAIRLDDNTLHAVPHGLFLSGHHIRRLDLQGDHWTDTEFLLMLPDIGLLEILTIDDTKRPNISTMAFQQLPRYCPHLTKLSLLCSTPITQSCIDAIAQHCHQLRELELYVNNLPEDTFKTLADCRSLSCLMLYNKDSVNIKKSYLSETMINDLAGWGDRLTHLACEGGWFGPTTTRMLTLINNSHHVIWPRLSSIHFDCGENLSHDPFIQFFQSHPRLQYVHLDWTTFDDNVLEKIATLLPILTHINMAHNQVITPHGVHQLIQRCHHLEKAEFFGCNIVLKSMDELSNDKVTLNVDDIKKIRQRVEKVNDIKKIQQRVEKVDDIKKIRQPTESHWIPTDDIKKIRQRAEKVDDIKEIQQPTEAHWVPF